METMKKVRQHARFYMHALDRSYPFDSLYSLSFCATLPTHLMRYPNPARNMPKPTGPVQKRTMNNVSASAIRFTSIGGNEG